MTDPNPNPVSFDTRPVEGFKDPDTGMAFAKDNFWSLVRKVQAHRDANKLGASVAEAMSLLICHVRKQQGLDCDGQYSKAAIVSAIGPKKCRGCVQKRIQAWRNMLKGGR